MNKELLAKIQLQCLYQMFEGRVEEDVIYIVYTENDSRIDPTIEQLLTISSSSFTGRQYPHTTASDNTDHHQANYCRAVKTGGQSPNCSTHDISSRLSTKGETLFSKVLDRYSSEDDPEAAAIEALLAASQEERVMTPLSDDTEMGSLLEGLEDNQAELQRLSKDSTGHRAGKKGPGEPTSLNGASSGLEKLEDDDFIQVKSKRKKSTRRKNSQNPADQSDSSVASSSRSDSELNSDYGNALSDIIGYAHREASSVGDLESESGTTDSGNNDDPDFQISEVYRLLDVMLLSRSESYRKAFYYNNRKMYSVSSYYADLARQITRKMEQKSEDLIELLLKKSENSDTIDLHGLNPTQACLVVTRLLKSKQEKLLIDHKGEVCVDIITGWGKHSSTNGRIRPCIISLLSSKKFVFQHLNRGALRVTVKRPIKTTGHRSKCSTPSPPPLFRP